MTRVLEDWSPRLLHRHPRRPGTGPGSLVLNRERVLNLVVRHARKPLHNPHLVTRTPEGSLAIEVRGLDH